MSPREALRELIDNRDYLHPDDLDMLVRASAEPASMWVAICETRHYSFKAAGQTKALARARLLGALIKHGKQLSLPDKWWHERYEISFVQYVSGKATRDGSPI